MKPYYADESVTLYHGDCREVAAWLEADVLVTDPPYGRGWQQRDTEKLRGWADNSHEPIAGDKDTALRDWALAKWGPSRAAAVFGDLLITPPVRRVRIHAGSRPQPWTEGHRRGD